MIGVIVVIACVFITGSKGMVILSPGQEMISSRTAGDSEPSSSPLKFLEKLPLPKLPKITSLSPIVPASITLPSEGTLAMSPVGKLLFRKEVAPAIRSPSQDLKFGDGDIIDRKVYIYKCKICDMPRMFKMKYGSFVF